MVSIGRQALDEAKKLLQRRKSPTGYEANDDWFAEQRRRWGLAEQCEIPGGMRGQILPVSISSNRSNRGQESGTGLVESDGQPVTGEAGRGRG